MNIIEVKNKIMRLNNDREYYLAKKEAEFIKTQPKSNEMQLVDARASKRVDRFAEYAINTEKYDKEINVIDKEINILEKWIETELKIIGEFDNIAKKIYDLRYDKEYYRVNRKFRPVILVAESIGYSESTVKRILKRVENKRNITWPFGEPLYVVKW